MGEHKFDDLWAQKVVTMNRVKLNGIGSPGLSKGWTG